MTFQACYSVDYVTNAIGWKNTEGNGCLSEIHGKLLSPQTGYFAESITVKSYEQHSGFMQCFLDFISIQLTIICRKVDIEKILREDVHFFWEDETTTFEKRVKE